QEQSPFLQEQSPFFQRLVEHDDVTIVGVTLEGLVENWLRPAWKRRKDDGKPFWKLQIVFPTERIAKLHEDQGTGSVANWNHGRQQVLHFLYSIKDGRADWKVLEFPYILSFVGQRYGQEPNEQSSVRCATILPGIDVKQSAYVEVFGETDAYKDWSESFQY